MRLLCKRLSASLRVERSNPGRFGIGYRYGMPCGTGLPRRCAPRSDGAIFSFISLLTMTLIASIVLIHSAHAQQRKYVQYSTGTGFFVSKKGHILTNAHVVENCKFAQVSAHDMVGRAKIIAKDTKHDMAILKANMPSSYIASMRPSDFEIEKGDRVVVVGHPLGKSLTTRSSELIANEGPLGEKQWMQFENSIFKGNSGGPLLDSSGRVVGMVTAKSTLYRYNRRLAKKEVVGNSDIAVRAHKLNKFLKKHQVLANYDSATVNLSNKRVENMAKKFVVQIKCVIR